MTILFGRLAGRAARDRRQYLVGIHLELKAVAHIFLLQALDDTSSKWRCVLLFIRVIKHPHRYDCGQRDLCFTHTLLQVLAFRRLAFAFGIFSFAAFIRHFHDRLRKESLAPGRSFLFPEALLTDFDGNPLIVKIPVRLIVDRTCLHWGWSYARLDIILLATFYDR